MTGGNLYSHILSLLLRQMSTYCVVSGGSKNGDLVVVNIGENVVFNITWK